MDHHGNKQDNEQREGLKSKSRIPSSKNPRRKARVQGDKMHPKYERRGGLGRPHVHIHTGIYANILDLDGVWVTPVDMFVETHGDGCFKSVRFIVCKLYWQEERGRETCIHQNVL